MFTVEKFQKYLHIVCYFLIMIFEITVLSFLWFTLYLMLRVLSGKPEEWCNRTLTLLHSLVICRMIEYSAYTDGNPLHRIGGTNTVMEEKILMFACSYFIFDTIWLLFVKSDEDPLILAHHAVGVLMLPLSHWYGSSGAEICVALWGGELTNPFLQYRFYLKYYTMQGSRLAFWNDFVFAVVFLIIRVIFFTVLCYQFMVAPKTHTLIKAFGLLFYFVGLSWSYKIIGFIQRKLM
eukprot:TCONS_00036363-protein